MSKSAFLTKKKLLVYQDEIHGYLFEQVEKTMDLLLTKYMKAFISYDGLHRIETYPFPETALREALLNAIAHKDYSGNTPIQISVYDHKIIFWNQGQLPETWTLESLTAKHGSVPYNPDIANAFFRASLIEAWGQGIFKMIADCIEAKVPPPIFKYNSSEFVIEFHGETDSLLEETVEKAREKTREKTREKILKFIGENNKITVVELADLLGITSKGVEYQITKLKGAGIIDRIGPDKGGTWIIL